MLKDVYNIPTREDYEGAIVAIHRLEDTYNLDPSDIRNGKMSQKYPSRPLTAYECFELGRIAYENEDFYHAIRWMNESLEQLKNEALNPTVERVDVLDYFSFANAMVSFFLLKFYWSMIRD